MKALVATMMAALAIVTAAPGAQAGYKQETRQAIWKVFGPRYARGAVRVAWCESRLSPRAHNGQYRGVFQMGSWERRKFGHGPTALAQAWAAWRYFDRTGRDWSPWSCRWAA